MQITSALVLRQRGLSLTTRLMLTKAAMKAALDMGINATTDTQNAFIAALVAANFTTESFAGASAQVAGKTPAELVDAGLVGLGPVLCSAAAVKDIPKDACVDLTEAGVDAQVAAAQGDAAAANLANYKIVGTLLLLASVCGL